MTKEEYCYKQREVNRSLDDLHEKGTPRDRLIQDLHTAITAEPTGRLPNPVHHRDLSLEEFQQFRSKIESLSEDQIREEIRKAKEEYERKKKAIGRYYPKDSAGTF